MKKWDFLKCSRIQPSATARRKPRSARPLRKHPFLVLFAPSLQLVLSVGLKAQFPPITPDPLLGFPFVLPAL